MIDREQEYMLSGDSVIVAIKDNVTCELDGESVILNIPKGVYYGLDSVGAFIWTMIEEPRSIHAIRDAILDEYEVEPDRCESDLLALIRDLAKNELVEVSSVTRC